MPACPIIFENVLLLLFMEGNPIALRVARFAQPRRRFADDITVGNLMDGAFMSRYGSVSRVGCNSARAPTNSCVSTLLF